MLPQRQVSLLLFLMLTAFMGLRLWRLNFPPTVFFDEFVSAKHAEEIVFQEVNREKHLQPSFPHPPFAFLMMAATMGMLHKVFHQKVILPFCPKSMVYLHFTDSVYFLSPDGNYLAVVSLKDLKRHRLLALKNPLKRLVASSHSTLYAISFTEELIWLDEEGRVLRIVPTPFLPNKVSATDSPTRPPIVLISQYQAGKVTLFDSYNSEFRWTIHLKENLSDVAFDTVYGLIYLAFAAQKKIITIDLDGKEVKHWHLDLSPSLVIPIAMPFLIPPKGYKGRSFIYVLDTYQRKVTGFDPTRNFTSVYFSLPTQIKSLSWHPKSPYIFMTDEQKIYAINGTTFQIAYTFQHLLRLLTFCLYLISYYLLEPTEITRKSSFGTYQTMLFLYAFPGLFLGVYFFPCSAFF